MMDTEAIQPCSTVHTETLFFI